MQALLLFALRPGASAYPRPSLRVARGDGLRIRSLLTGRNPPVPSARVRPQLPGCVGGTRRGTVHRLIFRDAGVEQIYQQFQRLKNVFV